MKHEAEVRELLINNAIHLIAEGGFEKATTKELTHCGGDLPNFKMNEVYIYRVFGSKESLYAAAFACLDAELHAALRDAVAAATFTGDLRACLHEVFLSVWQFILQNEERCRCYVRYYYSIYFKGDSKAAHKRLFEGMIARFSTLFKEEADVVEILHSVFTSLFSFGVRVYNGDLENNDENRPHVFNVLYCMMATYFKDVGVPQQTGVQ